jgi:hypothetical protein
MISLNDPFFNSSFSPENAVPQNVRRICFCIAVVSLSVYCLYCPAKQISLMDSNLALLFHISRDKSLSPGAVQMYKKPPSFRSAVVKTLLPLRAFGPRVYV